MILLYLLNSNYFIFYYVLSTTVHNICYSIINVYLFRFIHEAFVYDITIPTYLILCLNFIFERLVRNEKADGSIISFSKLLFSFSFYYQISIKIVKENAIFCLKNTEFNFFLIKLFSDILWLCFIAPCRNQVAAMRTRQVITFWKSLPCSQKRNRQKPTHTKMGFTRTLHLKSGFF
jgi:hypothetical protein